jgi:hypothetical protein
MFSISFYKNNYKDIMHYKDIDIIEHWIDFGIEYRLGSSYMFYLKYPQFKWNDYLEINSDISLYCKTENDALIHYWHYGFKEKRIAKKCFFDEIVINKNDYYNDYFNKININHVFVSPMLYHFTKNIMTKYYLQYNKDIKNNSFPTLFFGVYTLYDIMNIKNYKGKKYVMFGGSDIDILKKNKYLLDMLMKINVTIYFSISENMFYRLTNIKISSTLIKVYFFNEQIFKPIINNSTNDCIYIYNGFSVGNEHLYGKDTYIDVIKTLPAYNYIFSNSLNEIYENMPNIYAKCFIGLRLTKNDGNANTVAEMHAMNIPIIHNGEYGGIYWNNVNDVINTILKHDKKNIYYIDNKMNKITFNDKYFYDIYPTFNIEFYKKNYIDLQNKSDEDIMFHYYKYGNIENRIININDLLIKCKYNYNLMIHDINVLKTLIYNKYETHISIVVRTSNRPKFFEENIKSILSQNYDNYTIYVGYDNDSYEYVKNYNNIVKINVKKNNVPFFYNDYINEIINKIDIQDTWILILDDDDKFTSNDSLKCINNYIDNCDNYIYVWKYFRPDKIIYPININNINLGEICSCNFIFHKNMYNINNKFQMCKFTDYKFLKCIDKCIANKIFINKILTRSIFLDKIHSCGKTINELIFYDDDNFNEFELCELFYNNQ